MQELVTSVVLDGKLFHKLTIRLLKKCLMVVCVWQVMRRVFWSCRRALHLTKWNRSEGTLSRVLSIQYLTVWAFSRRCFMAHFDTLCHYNYRLRTVAVPLCCGSTALAMYVGSCSLAVVDILWPCFASVDLCVFIYLILLLQPLFLKR